MTTDTDTDTGVGDGLHPLVLVALERDTWGQIMRVSTVSLSSREDYGAAIRACAGGRIVTRHGRRYQLPRDSAPEGSPQSSCVAVELPSEPEL